MIELLVTIVIIGILVALLLPAVQTAREAARRTWCANNQRQLILAFQGYLESKGSFPPSRITTTGQQHGWIVDLLPYLEGKPIAEKYRLDKNFHAVENEAAVRSVLPVAICPTTPSRPMGDLIPIKNSAGVLSGTQGAVADYSVAYLLNSASAQAAGVHCDPPCAPYNPELRPVLYGNEEENKPHLAKWIKDGFSNTILIFEQSGRPMHYVLGSPLPNNTELLFPNWYMAWASFRIASYTGYDGTGKLIGATCAINCNNSQGIYSSHPTGANVALCDGSVRFLHSQIPVRVTFDLLTRAGLVPVDALAGQ